MLDTMTEDTADADLYARALDVVRASGRASTTYLQKALGVGYERARRLIDRLETEGVIGPADRLGKREVLPETPASAPTPDWMDAAAAASDRAAEASLPKEQPSKPPAGRIPMKETEADRKVRDDAYAVTADELRQVIEQYESLAAEKADIAEQQKDVMSEAKARGYNTKVIRKLIAMRKRDKDDLAEEEAILDLYKAALGME